MKNFLEYFDVEIKYSINDGEYVIKTINIAPVFFVILLVIVHFIIN